MKLFGKIYETKKKFRVEFKNKKGKKIKEFDYAKSRYGDSLAFLLAHKTLKECKRVNDYYVIKNDTAYFYIYTKAYGICEMVMDAEDVPKILKYKISIAKSRYTYYAVTKDGPVHRIILGNPDSKFLVDHINHNGLCNKKKNLRVVTHAINNKNAKVRADSKTGIRGVTYDKNGYRAYWSDDSGKLCQRSFSINIHGEELAKELAIKCRLKAEKKYGYTPISEEEGPETTHYVGIVHVGMV